jgi:GT2 family glycosyltransferase
VSTTDEPLVTILISAFRRPEELRITLRSLKEQDYANTEILVIDDASPESLEPIVKLESPRARFIRRTQNLGYIENRSAGLREARGKYVLILDDDASLTRPNDLGRTVRLLESKPSVAVIALKTHVGSRARPELEDGEPERLIHTFYGAANLVRRDVVNAAGGFRAVFVYGGEESDLALRLLEMGYYVLLVPSIVAHHRLSSINRDDARAWALGHRNSLWMVVLNYPSPQAMGSLAIKLCMLVLDGFRTGRGRLTLRAGGSFLKGLPTIVRMRKAVSWQTMRRHAILRKRVVYEIGDIDRNGRLSVSEHWTWVSKTWRLRRRPSSFWSARAGQRGKSPLARFTDEE